MLVGRLVDVAVRIGGGKRHLHLVAEEDVLAEVVADAEHAERPERVLGPLAETGRDEATEIEHRGRKSPTRKNSTAKISVSHIMSEKQESTSFGKEGANCALSLVGGVDDAAHQLPVDLAHLGHHVDRHDVGLLSAVQSKLQQADLKQVLFLDVARFYLRYDVLE